jgi:hypothetical protein
VAEKIAVAQAVAAEILVAVGDVVHPERRAWPQRVVEVVDLGRSFSLSEVSSGHKMDSG